MDKVSSITGVILAGGQSSRFGSNKALALLHGKPLIQHVAGRVTSIFSDCLLVTNSFEDYGFMNLPMVKDRYQDMGPMGGIHAALHYTANSWIFVVGCDMPSVTPEMIRFLCSHKQNDFDAVIPWLKTGPEPLCGLYKKTALNRIEQQLQSNKVQLKELLNNLSVKKVKEEELQQVAGGLSVFANINRKQDLEDIN